MKTRSFASLRMTRLRAVVILSEAKDLVVAFPIYGGKSRDFNAGMAEKMLHDCIGLG